MRSPFRMSPGCLELVETMEGVEVRCDGEVMLWKWKRRLRRREWLENGSRFSRHSRRSLTLMVLETAFGVGVGADRASRVLAW